MRTVLVMAMFCSVAGADELAERKKRALSATLCMANEVAKEIFGVVKSRAAILMKSPLDEGAARDIVDAQKRFGGTVHLANRTKAAMVQAGVGTIPCADRLIRQIVYCMRDWGADGKCSEPDIVLFRNIEGVPRWGDADLPKGEDVEQR